MTDDHDVATLLRHASEQSAPPMRLQADDVVRRGRRRRTLTRTAHVGGTAVAVAGLVAGGWTIAGLGDESAGGPVTATQSDDPPPFDYHLMPAILKQVALSDLDPLPQWAEFRIDALDRDGGLVPEARWDEASTWNLAGHTSDTAMSLTLMGDVEDQTTVTSDLTVCATYSSGNHCEQGRDGDRVQIWIEAELGESTTASWLGSLPPADAGNEWYVESITSFVPESGYQVIAQQAVQATSADEARGDGWYTSDQLIDLALDPSLDLGSVIPAPTS